MPTTPPWGACVVPLNAPTLTHLFSFLSPGRRTLLPLRAVCKEWRLAAEAAGSTIVQGSDRLQSCQCQCQCQW